MAPVPRPLAILGNVHQYLASARKSTHEPFGHTAQQFELQNTLKNTLSRLFSLVTRWCDSYRVVCDPKIKSGRLPYIMHTRCPVRHTRACTVLPCGTRVMLSDHQPGRGLPHEATPACREPSMRRYLRCPGAICCPACRALRAVLQPHRFCDELIADALCPLPRDCGASAHQLAATRLRRMLRARQAAQMPSGATPLPLCFSQRPQPWPQHPVLVVHEMWPSMRIWMRCTRDILCSQPEHLISRQIRARTAPG